MKVLVTAGATREPIDAVRFVSNVSTGATGAALAEAFAAAGHAVALLRGEGSARTEKVADGEIFTSATDLAERLRRRLAGGDFDVVIMAAAVADFRPEAVAAGKIPSAAEALTLRLVRNEKILPRLKGWSPQPLFVVGFKLTVGAGAPEQRAAVAAQFAAGGVDAIVHNDLAEIRVAPAGAHPFRLYRAADAKPEEIHGVARLAAVLGRSLLAGDSARHRLQADSYHGTA